MSFIAFILCCIFVVWLLKKDSEVSPGLSKALWIPSTWYLYSATRQVSTWLVRAQLIEGGGGTVESGNIIDRNFLTVLIVMALVVLHKRRINWQQSIKNNSWLFAFFLFMLVSIVWSDFPFVSLKRWIRTVGTVLMALVVLSEADPYEAIHAIIKRVVYVVIPFSFMLVKWYPVFGVVFGRWSGTPTYAGATRTKNTLGEVCVLGLFLILWTMIAKRQGRAVGAVGNKLGVTLVFLFFIVYLMKGPPGHASYSASSIVMFFVGVGAFYILNRLKDRLARLGRLVAYAFVGVGVLALVMNVLDISFMSIIAPALGRKANLTDRADLIWAVLLPIAWRNPVLGGGFGSFWITPVPNLTLDVNEAHNGYLDVFLELGIVGLILLVPVFLMYFRKARNELAHDFNWAAFRLSYLVMFLVHNWTETTLLRNSELLWNLFVLFMVAHPDEWTGRNVEKDIPAEKASSQQEASSRARPGKTPVAALDHATGIA